LGDQNLKGNTAIRVENSGAPADSLDALLRLKGPRISAMKSKPCPMVVAFNDPNDLLSYILAPAKQSGSYAVVDVVVSNAPTYFGLLEMPDKAHGGYPGNKKVQELMAKGHSSSGADTCGL